MRFAEVGIFHKIEVVLAYFEACFEVYFEAYFVACFVVKHRIVVCYFVENDVAFDFEFEFVEQ